MLKLLGLGSAAVLFGSDRLGSWISGAAAAAPTCVVRPQQTEGPYFVDEKLERSDLRTDPSDNSISRGVPLQLQFRVSRIAGGACSPLDDAIVDVWHCDALGAYSDVRDSRFDTRGKKFLRGFQRTNAKGMAKFLTIYPGWYPGRAVHIHFKIRTGPGQGADEFISQLYFDEAVNDRVFREALYNRQRGRRVMNDADFLFRRGGKELLLTPTKSAQGYTGHFDVALQSS